MKCMLVLDVVGGYNKSLIHSFPCIIMAGTCNRADEFLHVLWTCENIYSTLVHYSALYMYYASSTCRVSWSSLCQRPISLLTLLTARGWGTRLMK